MSYLANHKSFLHSNEWLSLYEMSDSNGAPCAFTCHAQAWSVACILDACFDFIKYFTSVDGEKNKK